jgi:hypothetical protein
MYPGFPVSSKGLYVTNVYDERGRILIPSAIFSTEMRYKLIGVGTLNEGDGSSSKFNLIADDVYMGMFNNAMYLRKEYPNTIDAVASYVTLIDEKKIEGQAYMHPYKQLAPCDPDGSGIGGIMERLAIHFTDADGVVLLVPYATKVPNDLGRVYFVVRKGHMLFRIPMPNTYADGTFCIGTGVRFDNHPSPNDLINGAYQSLMDDKYNYDLWESQYTYNRWEYKGGLFVMEKRVEELSPILNDPLLAAILS